MNGRGSSPNHLVYRLVFSDLKAEERRRREKKKKWTDEKKKSDFKEGEAKRFSGKGEVTPLGKKEVT